jgi:hypothetical protein
MTADILCRMNQYDDNEVEFNGWYERYIQVNNLISNLIICLPSDITTYIMDYGFTDIQISMHTYTCKYFEDYVIPSGSVKWNIFSSMKITRGELVVNFGVKDVYYHRGIDDGMVTFGQFENGLYFYMFDIKSKTNIGRHYDRIVVLDSSLMKLYNRKMKLMTSSELEPVYVASIIKPDEDPFYEV